MPHESPSPSRASGAWRLLRVVALAALAACGGDIHDAGTISGPPPASGSYAGFDTSLYPGDAAMTAWRAPGSPYRWVGYYLPAPCHHDASWTGHRASLVAAGWGLAVVYVGQQTWDGAALSARVDAPVNAPVDARVSASVASGVATVCSRTQLTAINGANDGDDAVARTAAEGFPRGTTIFLDLEHMDVVTPAMQSYYRAWVRQVLVDGRFRPGFYVHRANAGEIRAGVDAEYAAAGAGGAAAWWVTGGSGFALTSTPADVGIAYASAWQGRLDVARSWNGVTLTIDENVAYGIGF